MSSSPGRATSARRCDTYITSTPRSPQLAGSARTGASRSLPASTADEARVEHQHSSARSASAFAISTICWRATLQLARQFVVSLDRAEAAVSVQQLLCATCSAAAQSIRLVRRGRLPISRFSVTRQLRHRREELLVHRADARLMRVVRRAQRSAGVRHRATGPRRRTPVGRRPGCWISVDLPGAVGPDERPAPLPSAAVEARCRAAPRPRRNDFRGSPLICAASTRTPPSRSPSSGG